MRVPVRNLESNWAYMMMATLAWNLKSWFGSYDYYAISFANWNVQAFDCYNWDPGKAVLFVGNDTELCCLENSGRGKHFLVQTNKWRNS